MTTPGARWRRIKNWLNPSTFLDRWFDLFERSSRALRRLLDHGLLLNGRRSPKRTPYLPSIEGLELRVLMTSVGFNSATQQVNFNGTAYAEVDVSGYSNQSITVNYSTANGSAQAGVDYSSVVGTLVFSPGIETATIAVPMLNHRQTSNRGFSINLSSPVNATLGDGSSATHTFASQSVTILEPPLVYLKAAAQSVAYNGIVSVEVDLSNAWSQPLSVSYATGDVTAQAGVDYTAKSGTLTIPAWSTKATFAVALLNHAEIGDRTFNVTLTNSTVAFLSTPAVQTVTLVEPRPAVSWQSATQSVSFSAGTVTATANLAYAWTQAITVNYATSNGTALGGTDYTATSGTLTIPAGSTSGSVTVPLLGARETSNRTFSLTLSSPSNATLGSPLADTITIVEPPPIITNQTFRIAEGSAAGSVVGQVAASDLDSTRVLTYALTGGNTGGAFQINTASGQLERRQFRAACVRDQPRLRAHRASYR